MWNLHPFASDDANDSMGNADYVAPNLPDVDLTYTPADIDVVLDNRNLKNCADWDDSTQDWGSCTVKAVADDAVKRGAAVCVHKSKDAFWGNPHGGKKFKPSDFMAFVKAVKRY
jgi:hypothetical protein